MKLRALIADTVEQAIQRQTDSLNQSEWMSPRDAARYLGCTVQHLQNLRARRAGPAFVKFGRLIRYARADLDSFLLERRVKTE